MSGQQCSSGLQVVQTKRGNYPSESARIYSLSRLAGCRWSSVVSVGGPSGREEERRLEAPAFNPPDPKPAPGTEALGTGVVSIRESRT
jgi:hypothetical protein